MDVNDLRSIITVVSFVLFIGIVFWAWSSRRKSDFDEAARMPLDDDDKPMPRDDNKSAGQQGNEQRTSQ